MGGDEGGNLSESFLRLAYKNYMLLGKGFGIYGIVGSVIVGVILPFVFSSMFMGKKKTKQRAVQVDVGGEPGLTFRNSKFSSLIEVPWDGATTIASLFEQSCKKHEQGRFLGTRKLIAKEMVESADGKKFEKLHLGEYDWQSYREAFDRACSFASGLVKMGHNADTRAAIFSETRAEWLLSFQGCFRQNITVVTIYPSLGEDALIHSLKELVSWEEGGYTTSDAPMPRGEVVVGGPSVTKGYFENEVKTNEVYKLDEKGTRWFYTGDIGQFHPDGCLEIIDRKKDIVKLQHGEYISLGKVEAALAGSNYVDNIMVFADPFHNYCVALVVLSHQAIENWAQKTGIQYKNFAELCENDQVVNEVQKSLLKAAKSAKLDKFETPAKITLLPDPWTPESGLVTAALKLKREQVKSRFRDELQKLYH